ncbi:hypothetical protein S245_048737, partial [Arachis hypogaea]
NIYIGDVALKFYILILNLKIFFLNGEFVSKITNFRLVKICIKKVSIISLQCARKTGEYIILEIYNSNIWWSFSSFSQIRC